jgi:hypothetical protein
LFYIAGLFIGFFGFGSTVDRFWNFWNNSGFMGRFTIPQWLGLPDGVVVLIVVLMAIFMFWGAEKLETIFTARRGGVK